MWGSVLALQGLHIYAESASGALPDPFPSLVTSPTTPTHVTPRFDTGGVDAKDAQVSHVNPQTSQSGTLVAYMQLLVR